MDQYEAPDFRCQAPNIDFTVEATTVAPSQTGPLADHPNPKTIEERAAFLDDYMPMKFGSALVSKLNKKNAQGQHYWEREHSKNKPFVIAIADFHKSASDDELGSMTFTQSALWQYLYGSRVYWEFVDGQLIIQQQKIQSHNFKDKAIPSGFFDLESAENVSAVVFSNAGTLAKFDRMGTAAGFGAPNCQYIRLGFKSDPDPNAVHGKQFVRDVKSEGYEEYWTQEIQVFHNPNAKHKLPFHAMLGATHHFFKDNQLQTFAPDDAILNSYTILIQTVDKED